jgi:gas vesicle protein
MSNQSIDSGNYVKGFFTGVILGGFVGAITALLLAPKSGIELRRDLAEKSSELYDKASDYIGNMETHVGSVVQTAVNEGKERAQRIIESARKQADDLISDAEGVLKDARTKATSAKSNITDKIQSVREAAAAGAEAFKSEMKSNSPEDL